MQRSQHASCRLPSDSDSKWIPYVNEPWKTYRVALAPGNVTNGRHPAMPPSGETDEFFICNFSAFRVEVALS